MCSEFILEKVKPFSSARLLCLLACRQIELDNCVTSDLKTKEIFKGQI